MKLRKQCQACEKIAEPIDKNEYGDLAGWSYNAFGWLCPYCERPEWTFPTHSKSTSIP